MTACLQHMSLDFQLMRAHGQIPGLWTAVSVRAPSDAQLYAGPAHPGALLAHSDSCSMTRMGDYLTASGDSCEALEAQADFCTMMQTCDYLTAMKDSHDRPEAVTVHCACCIILDCCRERAAFVM